MMKPSDTYPHHIKGLHCDSCSKPIEDGKQWVVRIPDEGVYYFCGKSCRRRELPEVRDLVRKSVAVAVAVGLGIWALKAYGL